MHITQSKAGIINDNFAYLIKINLYITFDSSFENKRWTVTSEGQNTYLGTVDSTLFAHIILYQYNTQYTVSCNNKIKTITTDAVGSDIYLNMDSSAPSVLPSEFILPSTNFTINDANSGNTFTITTPVFDFTILKGSSYNYKAIGYTIRNGWNNITESIVVGNGGFTTEIGQVQRVPENSNNTYDFWKCTLKLQVQYNYDGANFTIQATILHSYPDSSSYTTIEVPEGQPAYGQRVAEYSGSGAPDNRIRINITNYIPVDWL